ncbi:peptide/nickel transport system ATP-binding protein [Bradyrhizobium ottawaense]|uniref:Peptide/nickel transport system ATP-binding protein n=2 Tax=Pseudomonadota TaxID=1224 RepID=A0ABV4FNC2_9BRAD
MTAPPAVSIKNLRIALPKGAERPFAVDGVSLDLRPGKIVCVVGESGSGKSMCAHALMGLLPDTVSVASGEIQFEGRDLLKLDDDGWRDLRGRRLAMIFQEPMTALNPLMRIGDQMAEMFEAHGLLTPRERRARALALAREVGLPDPERIVRAYPHQLSGGQRQRAMIAMALALEPAVLVADEPTTALDVTTQAQILKLIRNLQRNRNMAVMFITHDFGVVADIADQVVVLRHGKVVEEGPAATVFNAPQHDYTKALLAAVPSMDPPAREPLDDQARAVEVIGLDKTYVTSGGWFREDRRVDAARAVNFNILRGETLGLVGESGSGKSSVARLVMRLIEADRGTVRIGETDLTQLSGKALRAERHRIQMIFQDPFASLNPRRKIGHIIADGPIAAGLDPKVAFDRARDLLKMVGLDAGALERYPHEFSRRPAPAHRHCARARTRTRDHRRGRGRLRARRLRPGASLAAARRPQDAPRSLDAVHHPRSTRRRPDLRPHRGDAARRHRRAEADRAAVRRAGACLYARAAGGGAGTERARAGGVTIDRIELPNSGMVPKTCTRPEVKQIRSRRIFLTKISLPMSARSKSTPAFARAAPEAPQRM